MYKIMGIHFTNWAWLYSPLSFFMRIRVYPKSVSKETFFNQHNGKAIVYVLPRMSVMDTIVLNKTLKTFEQKRFQQKQNQNVSDMPPCSPLNQGRYFFQTHTKIDF